VSLTTLRARWFGHPPMVGDYLMSARMSARRPRYAYRVKNVTNASSEVYWDPMAKLEARRLQLVVVRVARDEVPRHARIHAWRWDKRQAIARSGAR